MAPTSTTVFPNDPRSWVVLSASDLVGRNASINKTQRHLAFNLDMSTFYNIMANMHARTADPTGRLAKIHEHIAWVVSTRGIELDVGPDIDDILFLTSFLAREFNQKTEMTRALSRGVELYDQTRDLHEDQNKLFANGMLSVLADETRFFDLSLYRISTIVFILAVYGDGLQYPVDPEFAQSYALLACECIGIVRLYHVPPECQAAVDCLHDTIQNLAWSAIIQPQFRLLCRLSGRLVYEDTIDLAANEDPTMDWGAVMRRRTQEITSEMESNLTFASP